MPKLKEDLKALAEATTEETEYERKKVELLAELIKPVPVKKERRDDETSTSIQARNGSSHH